MPEPVPRLAPARWPALLVGALVVAMLVVPFVGFAVKLPTPGLPPPDHSWEAVRARGTLRIGMDYGTPPFAFAAPDGSVQGYTVDLARDLAARLGLAAAITEVPTDGFLDALRTDRVDVIVSTLPPVPAFADIAYSAAYVEIGERVVIRRGSDLRTSDDLAGRRVGAELGSDGDLALRLLARRVALMRDSSFDTGDDALAALRTGSLDAVVMDGIAARRAVAGDPTLALLPTTVLPRNYALATRRANASLTAHTDAALATARATGVLARLDDRWLAHGP